MNTKDSLIPSDLLEDCLVLADYLDADWLRHNCQVASRSALQPDWETDNLARRALDGSMSQIDDSFVRAMRLRIGYWVNIPRDGLSLRSDADTRFPSADAWAVQAYQLKAMKANWEARARSVAQGDWDPDQGPEDLAREIGSIVEYHLDRAVKAYRAGDLVSTLVSLDEAANAEWAYSGNDRATEDLRSRLISGELRNCEETP